MSERYERYLSDHLFNVATAYYWLEKNLPEVLEGGDFETQICEQHDRSKYKDDEYHAYDAYFYGSEAENGEELGTDEDIKREFDLAWLRHIHRNPHHWQYWVLIDDDHEDKVVALDIPHNYIIEMICDWWSFSWKQKKLDSIFAWYKQHGEYMNLSEHTREKVEDILLKMREKLDERGGYL